MTRLKMNKKITAIEPQKNNKNRYSVFLDGEYGFSLDDETLVKSRIKVGSELSGEDVRYLTEEAGFSYCKEYGMKLLSRKRYTKAELCRRLQEKGFECAEDVCERFLELNLLDDREYARCFISDAMKISGKGERVIRLELKRKGISDSIIDEMMDGFENNDALLRLVEKKFKGRTNDRKTAASVFASCIRKGFGADEIRSAIRKYTDEEFADD